MATTFSDIGVLVGRALQDPDHIRWTEGELSAWIYEAQREIARIAPDAYVKTMTVAVTANKAMQSLSALAPDAARLIDIPRCVTSDKAVRQTERRFLDAEQPGWTIDSGSSSFPTHYCYDQRNPLSFWLYPVPAACQIEIVYSAIPPATWTTTTLGTTAIVISESYVAALLDYVLYRAYSKDADYAANDARAQWHKKAFYEALKFSKDADVAAEPSGKRPT